MKFVVVTPEYPPYQGGGIGTATVSFVENMIQAGHEVDVFAIFAPDLPGYNAKRDEIVDTDGRGTVHYLAYELEGEHFCNEDREILSSFLTQNQQQARSWVMAKKLGFFLRVETVDVIFSAEYMGLPTYFFLEQKLLPPCERVPAILTLHTGHRELNHANYYGRRNLLAHEKPVALLEQVAMEEADLLHCPSQFLADFINKAYLNDDAEIHIIPYFKAFGKTVGEHNAVAYELPERQRVLFVGRLERRKGFKEFVQAAIRLLKEEVDCEFVIAGGEWFDEFVGKYYSEQVNKLIPDDFKGRFDFKGSVPHENLPKLIRSADLVVVPSLFENYPNTTMEPVQLGVPVLMAGSGGMKEIAGDFEPMVVNPLDTGAFAASMKAFLLLDPEQRVAIQQRQASHFEAKHQPEIIKAAYEDLVVKAKKRLEETPESSHKLTSIGIGIPVFNTGPYLDECLGSVFSQSRKPDRVVVVNDGSTEQSTLSKLQEWQSKEPFLEVINQENRGLCGTRNKLLQELQGMEALLLLDSDDALHKDYLLHAEKYLLNNPDCAAVKSWVRKFEGDTDLWLEFPFRLPQALWRNMIISSVALIRTSVLEKPLKFNEALSPFTAEDWDFWIKFRKRGNKIGLIPKALFLYRVRKGSKWHSLNRRKFLFIIQHLINEHRDVYHQYLDDVLLELYPAYSFPPGGGIWASVANVLPNWLLVMLRRNPAIKKLGMYLLSRG